MNATSVCTRTCCGWCDECCMRLSVTRTHSTHRLSATTTMVPTRYTSMRPAAQLDIVMSDSGYAQQSDCPCQRRSDTHHLHLAIVQAVVGRGGPLYLCVYL